MQGDVVDSGGSSFALEGFERFCVTDPGARSIRSRMRAAMSSWRCISLNSGSLRLVCVRMTRR